tara:strand:+ start:774 stop:935 length:162 start_codon:yes stop_codon:yes gene_type:complete
MKGKKRRGNWGTEIKRMWARRQEKFERDVHTSFSFSPGWRMESIAAARKRHSS